MTHGGLHPEDMTAYLLLEAASCTCEDDPCDCGWDETTGIDDKEE